MNALIYRMQANIYVCMHVRMYICSYVCMHASWICVRIQCIHVWMHVCVNEYMNARVYVCMHVHVYVHECMYAYIVLYACLVYLCMHTYLHRLMQVYMYVCVLHCIHVFMYVGMYCRLVCSNSRLSTVNSSYILWSLKYHTIYRLLRFDFLWSKNFNYNFDDSRRFTLENTK